MGEDDMDMKKAILAMVVLMFALPMASAAIESIGDDYYSEGGAGGGGDSGGGTTPTQPPTGGGTIGGAGKPIAPAEGKLNPGGSTGMQTYATAQGMQAQQGLPPATGSTDSIKNAVCQIYNMINIALPAIIFLMVVLAAAIYAAGQIMSAEMRSRASVWANSLLIGAVFAVLIWIIVPPVLNMLLGSGSNIQQACPLPSSSP